SPCPFCADLLPNPLPEKICLLLRKIANQNSIVVMHLLKIAPTKISTPTSEDKLTFCEIHQVETTIVSDSIQKGYLMQIDFGLLETRIFQMKTELLNIINRKANSYYCDFALKICNKIGSRKARYYGQCGLNIISNILSKLFLDTNLLTYDLVFLKKPVDYLQEILVPETVLHLIFQDKGGLELELARKIMKDSANFGDYIYSE
ncbi:24660_t:CDS:2, partial [Gigaspora margarita]